ncbi:MAG: folate-binding protein YgfZ [Burkholderiales bacterium]|nr:folate-binding protein YgfZ [Burkholderiales bacterium]
MSTATLPGLDLPAVPADPAGVLPLEDWGLIRARGDDARRFLHAQLTQDVEGLPPGQARLAGYCSAKGRLLASFVVWADPASGDILLACSADLLAATLKRLSMFVLRAKCKLGDASAELPLAGLAGPAAAAAGIAPWGTGAAHGGTLIRLPDAAGVPRALLAGGTPPTGLALAPQAWAWLEVASGVPRIVAATAEQFVPQMVNLDLVGGVNFHKGCYPGQEVVARSQYRGTLKRRMLLAGADAQLQPGQEVFAAEDPGQPAGMIVNAAPAAGGGAIALVEVKLAARAQALSAGAPGGPALRLAALPYAIPETD